jgi:hypothetical protein
MRRFLSRPLLCRSASSRAPARLFVRAAAPLTQGTARNADTAPHSGKDPIKEHLWRCTDAHDVACNEAYSAANPGSLFCQLDPSSWEWTHKDESVRSDLGLYCDRGWLMDLTNSVFFLGFLIGAATWGAASDKYGRRKTLMAVVVLSALTTASTAITYSYFFFMLARFLSGAYHTGAGCAPGHLSASLQHHTMSCQSMFIHGRLIALCSLSCRCCALVH